MTSLSKALLLLSTLDVCLDCPATNTAFAEELSYKFRGGGWDEKLFRLTGANTLKAMRVDAGGLRITLAKDRTSNVPVGLCTRFGIRGDFEITMTYEILRIDKPVGGNGAGTSIYLSMASATQDAAVVARQVQKGGEQVFTSMEATTPAGQKRTYIGGKPISTQTRTGKLRFLRKGAELTYLVAQNPTGPFQELHKTDWGTGDLNVVRFAAENGGAPVIVDVRIKDVQIRADGFGAARAVPSIAQQKFFWWLAGAILISVSVVVFWWWRRMSVS